MKKCLLILATTLCINCLYSQVLYTENFDNHSVGNLGTDVTGKTPGQWGWYTLSYDTQANSFFTIVNETGRGKVLDITTGLTNNTEELYVFKKNLHTLVANRTPGNDVLMFEIDYYTGSKQSANITGNHAQIELSSIGEPIAINHAEPLARITFDKIRGTFDNNSNQNQLNTWIKIIMYLDYPNKKVYYHIPYLNKVYVKNFLSQKTSTNLIQDFPVSNIMLSALVHANNNTPLYTRNRYDNIKLTALNAVPPSVIALNTNEQLAAKFNMYPNPATNIVNITNAENMLVNQVIIYNITGKQVSTQSFNNQAEIQLNVEKLAKGTYLLHVQTNEGTAIKKLVKK